MGHTQKWVPVFPLCTNTSILAPAISLTTRLYSHLCSIYNQKYCHFIVVCNMFDQQSSITVVWTILQAQERQRQFYYSSSYLLFLCVIDLHCRCLITLCVIYILCNLYLFMSHPPYMIL